jgi:hypothetical protein
MDSAALSLAPEAPAVPADQPAAVVEGTLAAELVHQPEWLVVVSGDRLRAEIEVKNSGTAGWLPGEVNLVLESSADQPEKIVALRANAGPGDKAAFAWTSSAFTQAGIFTKRWQLQRNGELLPGGQADFRVVVLPGELEAERIELQRKIESWAGQPAAEIETQIQEWVKAEQEKVRTVIPLPLISLKDLVWIPATMLPVAGVLIVMILKIQKSAS